MGARQRPRPNPRKSDESRYGTVHLRTAAAGRAGGRGRRAAVRAHSQLELVVCGAAPAPCRFRVALVAAAAAAPEIARTRLATLAVDAAGTAATGGRAVQALEVARCRPAQGDPGALPAVQATARGRAGAHPQELPSVPEPDPGTAPRVAATFSRSAAAGAPAAQREIAAMSGHDAGRCGGQFQVSIGNFAPIQATASVRSALG